jgi:transposase
VLLQTLLPYLTPFRLRAYHWIGDLLYLELSGRPRSAGCPVCQHRSMAVHSSYVRTVADLPIGGAKVLIHLQVRRFFCRQAACPRRIFAERFPTLVSVYGRHTRGVCTVLRHIGTAIGGRAGVRLAHALGILGSSRTIVRLIHGAPFPALAAPRVIGLDEWAWRRGRRFGTIVCDLERREVIDLLPERSAPSVAQWLRAHPSVEIVCRDRSRLYAEGIRCGAPQAVQVVDRFHLVQNLGDALERFFLRHQPLLNILGTTLPHGPADQSPAQSPSHEAAHQPRHER